ncbi:MAG: hypothetical protein K2O83_00195, partial [Schaedlerella arabinosiphila]|nr:hypothetical protein [Schaedlerella arabinosiphila]
LTNLYADVFMRQFQTGFLQFPLLLAKILPKLPVAFQKAQFTSEGQIVESVLNIAAHYCTGALF